MAGDQSARRAEGGAVTVRMGSALLVRADASADIGVGHVMRCLALAQAWQESGGSAAFATASAAGLERRLQCESAAAVPVLAMAGSEEDARETIEAANRAGACWVVVDGYCFGADYQRAIKAAGLRLLFVDDNGHASHYCADVVLNQNLHAREELYAQREPHTRLLLGPRYALLRREFWKWRGWTRDIPDVARKVLVTLGGGDPHNVTRRVLDALRATGCPDLDVVVVAGPSNPHYDELRAAVAAGPIAWRLEQNVHNMPDLMAWADVAVSAAGSTCWELAFMGLPSLLVATAGNQIDIAAALYSAGVAANLGQSERLRASDIAKALGSLLSRRVERARMSSAGRGLVDGAGASRVVERLRHWNSSARVAYAGSGIRE
jgi:UDP-2,4-diacetamido-2,4,6-trideoxy-beta-L-altropyranose hydrolase